MTADAPAALAAVILAGGQARRMGGIDKGLVDLAGRPMIEHVLLAVRPAVDRVMINANRHQAQYREFGAEVVGDLRADYPGPLAGLEVALEHLHAEESHLFLCPCDSPFILPALIERLAGTCRDGDHDVAVAHDATRLQPVFSVLHRRVHASLVEYLDRGERKIDRWFASLDQVIVDCQDLIHSFRNINREDERQAAESAFGMLARDAP